MKYRIELAATAKADIRDATHWLSTEASPIIADTWLTKLQEAIFTLETYPFRCPLAAEHPSFSEDIRTLHHDTYRILFTVRENTVMILYVHHSARDEIKP